MSRAAAAFAALVVLTALPPRPSLAAEAGRAADEKAIRALETEWSRAAGALDLASLDKILGEDWIGIGPFGTFTKAQSIADLKSGALKIASIGAPEEMKVRFFGDVAVVTGAHQEKGSYRGKEYDGRWVWTDVWAKRKGKWQAVASQSTLLPPK